MYACNLFFVLFPIPQVMVKFPDADTTKMTSIHSPKWKHSRVLRWLASLRFAVSMVQFLFRRELIYSFISFSRSLLTVEYKNEGALLHRNSKESDRRFLVKDEGNVLFINPWIYYGNWCCSQFYFNFRLNCFIQNNQNEH